MYSNTKQGHRHSGLRGPNTLDRLSTIFTRETSFVTFRLLSAQQDSSEKGSTFKRKNLLSQGANSFFLEKIYFSKGCQDNFVLTELSPLKVYNSP